jgi:hypothetical protein
MTLIMTQTDYAWEMVDGINTLTQAKRFLELESCDVSRFVVTNDTDYLSIGSQYVCPRSDFNLTLQGNLASKKNRIVQISLMECN